MVQVIMTPKRAAAWFGGSTLLGAWLAAAAPSLAPEQAVTIDRTETAAEDGRVLMLAAETERLRERLSVVAARKPMTRNPFRFASKATQSSWNEAPDSVALLAAVVPSGPPPIVLLGVAESTRGEALERTAILSLSDELFLVKEGEPVGPRHRVSHIGADDVELVEAGDLAQESAGADPEPRTFRIGLP